MWLSLVWRHQNFIYALPNMVSTIYRRKKHVFKMWRFKGFMRPYKRKILSWKRSMLYVTDDRYGSTSFALSHWLSMRFFLLLRKTTKLHFLFSLPHLQQQRNNKTFWISSSCWLSLMIVTIIFTSTLQKTNNLQNGPHLNPFSASK